VKPTFRVQRGASVDQVQDEVKRVLDELGNFGSKELPLRAVGPNETRIAHGLGRVPDRWRLYSHQDGATIQETRPPDSKYLYLRNVKPVASLADEDWASSVKRRMLALTGLPEGRAVFRADDFQEGAGTSFPRWARSATGTGSLTHVTNTRGGVARWTYTTPFVAWPVNDLTFDGEQVFGDAADERFAFACRMSWSASPAGAGAFMDTRIGPSANAGTNYTYFGVDGSRSTTNCVFRVGATALVLATTIAAFFNAAEHELMIVQRPEGGNKVNLCYIDGEEVGRVSRTTTLSGRQPYMGVNFGVCDMDDVAWLVDGALGGTAVEPLSAVTQGTAGTATVGIEVL
jgi:hypothetical protein